MEETVYSSDTICALATPPGIGAIAVIRVSGPDAISLCNRIFSAKDLNQVPSHTAHFGTLKYDGKVVDEVLLTVFKAPHSFTGENAVEISTHGSPYIQQKVIQLLVTMGIRLANPGEFTMRAFLNKKMDLSQAEAVADVIAANSEASHALALKQMRGGFSTEIERLRGELIHFASLIELELDFGEEDVEFADRADLKALVDKLTTAIGNLIVSFNYGNVIKTGVPVAIVGEPNVGKSTFLNALLNEDKAIVSDVAGTTRDAIEDETVIHGVTYRFIDTAGIRDTEDKIESIGIQRSFEKVDLATVVLLLVDAVTITEDKLQSELNTIRANMQDKHKLVLIVANKVDKGDAKAIEKKFEHRNDVVLVSAKEKLRLEIVKERLHAHFEQGKMGEDATVVTNVRHYEALTHANDALEKVVEGLQNNVTGDFLAMDIRQALHYLSLITGSISTDDLLDNIFSKFCIGK